MPGDEEYEGDIRYLETSTPGSTMVSILDSQPYWTKHNQWEDQIEDDISMDLAIQEAIHENFMENRPSHITAPIP